MSNVQDLENIEVTLEQAQEAVALRKAFRNLLKNKDFKLVVETGYFEKEAVRLVLLKADANMQDEKLQSDIIRCIDGIGSFREYLRTLDQMGAMAERSITADEATREELLREQLEEGE